ncbi:MAG: 2-oxoglutarate dehydrogenase E1 component [Thermoanaerobaculia bacterium]|nr:2-oxoglutarate dehydrogenase E1 component [Thermoanaerobaculia bacterium]
MATDVQTTPDLAVLETYRRWGHLAADLDPLGRLVPAPNEALLEVAEAPGADFARRAYCGTLTVEAAHIPEARKRRWIAERMEAEPAAVHRQAVLSGLVRAETFEQFLGARYLGTKRFSLEGVTALVPYLQETFEAGAEQEVVQMVVAMSHRGRLNVMLNVIGRKPEELLAGFEDVDPKSVLGGGDVKYHLGATGEHHARNGKVVKLHLASNPSHLEAVDPVVVGRVRAKQTRWRHDHGQDGRNKIIPILLHGDAAFAGQGIVAETLNLASLDGYDVGGTIHVVVNNLIGFTTEPHALWSWRFSTDVAKRLPIPIFHVNGEDPDAVARVARIAFEYRQTFGSDVVVDLIGYRRHGHNEGDDPTTIQPRLYREINARPRLWELYAERVGLAAEGRALADAFRAELDVAQKTAAGLSKKPKMAHAPDYWKGFHGGFLKASDEVDTGIDAARIAALAGPLTTIPDGFHPHKTVARLAEQRAKMAAGEAPIDFGMGEHLAFASLVAAGVPVRLSGQDCRRATFSQRHAVWIDIEDEHTLTPLQHVAPGQALFEVYDSCLSEAAVMGFEYGFSRDYPEALVMWEAQFGDFVNGAQIIIDQFLAAAEDKWGLLSGLVLLLPHGFEGQGPEHSSARIERFLQLAAEENLQVCQPSNAAQYFHLLRRQALRKWRKPLVVFTPKSMLRAKEAASTLDDLARPRFQNVLADASVSSPRRVLIATGKILHELRRERAARKADDVAIVGLEQLYPFPEAELKAELARLGDYREVVWVQEEPANMGAHDYVRPRLERLTKNGRLRTVKRAASASPATGSAKAHAHEQKTLLGLAFTELGAGKKG